MVKCTLSHTARACSQVDEGIEAMLCCWLQQLQEFGGPEVEKPDLLQLGSVNSLRPYLQAGGGNIPRHTFFKDPRARYNVSIPSSANLTITGYSLRPLCCGCETRTLRLRSSSTLSSLQILISVYRVSMLIQPDLANLYKLLIIYDRRHVIKE